MTFNPFDSKLWQAGSSLNWWDSALNPDPPFYASERSEAERRFTAHMETYVALLRLIHQYRTATTNQLHDLDPRAPQRADALTWMDLLALGLIDVGYPINVGGGQAVTPRYAPFMAVRLPKHRRIERDLRQLGVPPMWMASFAPGSLRGMRQYDRHNLICTRLAIAANDKGYATLGEAWGRFDLICHDKAMGMGGPDLIVFSQTIDCVELTASANQALQAKFDRWARVLAHPGCERVHVTWLAADPDDGLLSPLTGLSATYPRMHAGLARDWADTLRAGDGHGPHGTAPAQPGWMRGDMDRVARAMGFASSAGWRMPDLFTVFDRP